MLKRRAILQIALLIPFLLPVSLWGQDRVQEEARRYLDRGRAAVEIAKNKADYRDAIGEFEKAKALAPDWPEVYYNLGLLYEEVEDYDKALNNLRAYLRLAPNASDAQEVKSMINKLEYKREKSQAESRFVTWLRGKWLGNPGPNNWIGWPVRFIIEGDSIYFYAPTGMDVDRSTFNSPVFYNYQKIPVTREGDKVKFKVALKTLFRSSNKEWSQNANYNLTLMGPGKLEGTVVISGKRRAAHFWKE